jgi:hypothetical protein
VTAMAFICWIHFGVLIQMKVAVVRPLSRQAKEANQIVAWPAMRREVVTFALKQAGRCALGVRWPEPTRGPQSQLRGRVRGRWKGLGMWVAVATPTRTLECVVRGTFA